MEQGKNYKYYVVEFPDPLHQNFDKYVCVPDSWIMLREIADQTAIIKHPVEEASITKKRVKKNELYSDDWTIFVVHVKYGTDSYKDAKKYINVLYTRLIEEQRLIEIANEGNEPSIPWQTSSESSLAPGPSSNIDVESTSNNTASIIRKSLPNLETFQNHDTLSETSKSGYGGRRYFTRRAHKLFQFAKGEQSAETDINTLNKTTSDSSDKQTNDTIAESARSPSATESISSIGYETSKLPGGEDPLSNPEPRKQPVFGNDFTDLLKEMYSCLEKNHLMFDYMRLQYLKRCSELKGLIQLLERFNSFYNEPVATISDDEVGNLVIDEKEDEKTEVETDIVKNNKSKRKYQVDDEFDESDDDGNYSDDVDDIKKRKSTPVKKRGQPRKFTLPPDYDEYDSRWTLKYREKNEELVELMPHSGIYVNAIKLSNCKMISKDSKTLARMLLTEVFSESALRTCSWTGKKANAFNFDEDEYTKRPGLDEHARTVLLNFVEQHKLENNWVTLDMHAVLGSIRSKIQETRSRYW